MKKVIRLLSIFLVLFLAISCSNTIGPDDTSEPSPSGIELTLKNIENAPNIYINRYKEGSPYGYFMNVSSAKGNKIIDYFVTPGQTYEYHISYWGENERIHEDKITITASQGIGELTLSQKPVASFDSSNSTLNFSTLPTLIEHQDRFIRNNNFYRLNYSLNFNTIVNNSWVGSSRITKSIDMATVLSDNNREEYFGKQIYASMLYIEVNMNDIYYQASLDTADFSIPKPIVVTDTRPELVVTPTSEGNKITIPQITLDNLRRYEVRRYDEKGNHTLYFSTDDLTKTEFIDYFVDAGTKYAYQLSYVNNDWNKIKETKKSQLITSNGGVGDLKISDVKFTYDETTGIMNFTSVPQLKDQVDKINAKNKSPRITYGYRTQDTDKWFWPEFDYNTKSVNLYNTVIGWNDSDEYIGKTVSFVRVDLEPRIDGVYFQKGFNKEELVANNCTVIDTLTIPDLRLETEVLSNAKGIEIKLGEIPANCRWIWISRRDVATQKEEVNYIYVPIDKKNSQIIDYFVTPNSQYQYKIIYRVDNGDDIQSKYSAPITATNGVSQLMFNNFPNVTYDESTTIMTFTPKPDFTEQINKLQSYGINISYNDYNLELSYSSENTNTGNRANGYYNNDTGTINWSQSLARHEWAHIFYNTNLRLDNINISANIDSISYQTNLSREALLSNIKDFPEIIKVKDLRIKTRVESVSNGLRIHLDNVPQDCRYVQIAKKNLTTNKTEWNYIECDVSKKNSQIIDYFVTPNNKYQYQITYKTENYNNRVETLYCDPITANNGVGDFDFYNNLKATYDDTTGIMTFDPKPNFDTKINALNQYGLNVSQGNFELNVFYEIPDTDMVDHVYGKLDKTEGIINWRETFIREQWMSDYYDTNLSLESVNTYSIINDIRYNSSAYGEDIQKNNINLPKTIFVKDTREKTIVSRNAQGIKIELGTIPSNCTSVQINRKLSNSDKINDNYMNFSLDDYSSKETINPIDYFVSSDKQYQYEISFYDKNYRFINSTIISDPITPNNGVGELVFRNMPHANYDNATTIMSFDPKPDFTPMLNNLKSKNVTIPNYGPSVDFGYSNPNVGSIWGQINNFNDTINWSNILDTDRLKNHYNEDYHLFRINIYFSINNIRYKKEFYDQDWSRIGYFVPTINIKDLRTQQTN